MSHTYQRIADTQNLIARSNGRRAAASELAAASRKRVECSEEVLAQANSGTDWLRSQPNAFDGQGPLDAI